MKNLITILILFLFGCGKTENATEADTKSNVEKLEAENKRLKAEIENEKLKSDTASENKKHNVVIGSYERKVFDFDTFKLVLLENGKSENWKNGEKRFDGTWEIVGPDIHVVFVEFTSVCKIEPNGDLTNIALIKDGKRENYPKVKQRTWNKLSEAENKRQKAWLENNYVVGSYEAKIEEDTFLLLTINKRNESGWGIVEKELQVEDDSKISVYRIEANGDLTEIAKIEDGERTDLPKEDQVTFKKINWQSAPERD
jgi:hypothetical protein